MNKKEWANHHGFDQEDMYIIEGWVFYYGGIITKINEKDVDISHTSVVTYNQ